MLDFADKALNQSSLPITPGIVLTRLFGIYVGRNDRFNAAGDEFIHKSLRPIASSSNHALKLQVNAQVMGFNDVMALLSRRVQPQRIAQLIDGSDECWY
jgi:hypothetical protein